MSAEAIPQMIEQFSGAAIDAARISASTAQILVSLDETLPPDLRAEILSRLEEGLQWLHAARELMPVENATSVHIIPAERPGIIVPS